MMYIPDHTDLTQHVTPAYLSICWLIVLKTIKEEKVVPEFNNIGRIAQTFLNI